MQSGLTVAAWVVLGATVAGAAEPIVWGFAGPELGWRPRSAGIKVERVDGAAAAGAAAGALRISGRQEDGWNYAVSEPRPMPAGQLYRLTARVRVDQLGPGAAAPFLKCEFVAAEAGRSLGRATTPPYDPTRPGQWQELNCEFRAPDGTVAAWVALEKGGREPAEITALLDTVVVEPIARLTADDRYRLEPLPEALARGRGVHPRLYLTAARVAELRAALQGTHARLWEPVQAQAAAAARRGAPPYVEQDGHSGAEQLWQREVGNTLPLLAMAWVLSGDRLYLEAAQAWALASCGYATWGLGRTDGMDLAAGHQLFGLALVYDWCGADLDPAARETVRATLVRRAGAMCAAAASGEIWWHRSYLQNHLWVNLTGMAAAGFALFDEVDGADRWIGLALDKFRTTMAALGPDGASHEGVGYWQYGTEYMLKFMDLAAVYLDEDLFAHAWWQHTAAYAQYLALPRQAWTRRNCIVDLADCPRNHWYGPDYILRRLAREYRDGRAQWLADEIAASGIDTPSARWLNLVWYDPAVAAQSPAELPTLKHFEDMGIVVARSDWSGEEALLVFKCGPFIGHDAIQRFTYDPGGGHVHPDANHLVIFAHGEWVLRDDGYRAKWTGQHNTLLVDGRGQLGEGHQWFAGREALSVKSRPRVVRAESGPRLDHLAGDATAAYPESLGLTRYVRHLIYLKPDVLIVVDDLAAREEHDLELRFHPESAPVQTAAHEVMATGAKAALRLRLLTPTGVTCRVGEIAAAGRGEGVSAPMQTVALSTRRAVWRHAVALSWAPAGAVPAPVTLSPEGEMWVFQAEHGRVQFDWQRGVATWLP